ncbi:MAG TPA: dipeptide epimerase [Planctomycetota bacterium]|nr:dipeptide epimerase [Planctomycetota bacterium]
MAIDLSRRDFLVLSSAASLAGCASPQAARRAPGDATLAFDALELKLRHTWTIARGSSDAKKNGLLTLTADGVAGYGEAAPNVRYHQSFDSASAAFDRIREATRGLSPWEHRVWIERAESVAGEDSEVVAALDAALWDWKGKRCGQPIWRLLGTSEATMPVTSFSIGIDTPDAMAAKTREASAYPLLKLKVGLGDDEANVRAVRGTTTKPIRVDANEGWKTADEAVERIRWLASQGCELVEQPLAAANRDGNLEVTARSPIPVVADEATLRVSDLRAAAGAYAGVNVKLSKCGGITRALDMLTVARALGLKVMLGCMIESSLGIAAGVAIAPLFDWVDLDGNLLVANDPFAGLEMRDGRWRLPQTPGLGVARTS